MKIELNQATIKDSKFIKLLFNNPEYELYFYENDTPIEIWEERFEYYKIKESNIIYTDNNLPIGWILYSLDKDTCNIDIIVLKSELRGNQYGYFALKELEKKLQSNIKHIKLDVQKRNQKAVNFYKRYGFKIISEETQYTKEGKIIYYNMLYELKNM